MVVQTYQVLFFQLHLAFELQLINLPLFPGHLLFWARLFHPGHVGPVSVWRLLLDVLGLDLVLSFPGGTQPSVSASFLFSRPLSSSI